MISTRSFVLFVTLTLFIAFVCSVECFWLGFHRGQRLPSNDCRVLRQ